MNVEDLIVPNPVYHRVSPVNDWIERPERATSTALACVIECPETASRQVIGQLFRLGQLLAGDGKATTHALTMIGAYQDSIATDVLHVNERGGWTLRCSIILPNTYHMDRLIFDGFGAFVTTALGDGATLEVSPMS